MFSQIFSQQIDCCSYGGTCRMATVKHIASKNNDYCFPLSYLTFQYSESTNRPVLDENGHRVLRGSYLITAQNCDSPYTFASECLELNRFFNKNKTRNEIKTHHYIISFDPRDKILGLTMERAQKIGKELASRFFPGHQALICTHPDGHHKAGNIHVHIVINSLRKNDVDRQEYMKKPSENKAGFKHISTRKFNNLLKQETMRICEREGLHQVDLMKPAAERITEAEYHKQDRGQKKLDQINKKISEAGLKPKRDKYDTDKSKIRAAVRSAIRQAHTEDEFRKILHELYHIEITESRGKWGFRSDNMSRPIRGRMLGTRYEKEYILSNLSAVPELADIAALNNKAATSYRYKKAMELQNNKAKSATINYLMEHGLQDPDVLQKNITDLNIRLQQIQLEKKEMENHIRSLNLLIHRCCNGQEKEALRKKTGNSFQ